MNMTVPYDREAEECIVASMMVEPRTLTAIAGYVKADDFWMPACREIFETELRMFERGEMVSIQSLSREMGERLAEFGGRMYLLDIERRMPVQEPESVKYYADIVRTDSTYRKAIRGLTPLVSEAHAAPGDIQGFLDALEEQTYRLRRESGAAGVTDGAAVSDEVADNMLYGLELPGTLRGKATGWTRIDSLIDGLCTGRLITVGGATSVGKSLFCHNLCMALGLKNIPVTIFTNEMSQAEAVTRLIYMQAGVDPMVIRDRGYATDEEKARCWEAKTVVDSWPLRYADEASPTLAFIRNSVRKDKALRGTEIFVIDHVGFIEGPGKDDWQKLTAITKGLKSIAQKLEVCIVVTSHVRRDGVRAADYLALTDLARSSSIEKDSDQVILMTPVEYRQNQRSRLMEWVALADRQAKARLVEHGSLMVSFDVAKNRHGKTGGARMVLDWARGGGRFTEARE